MKKIIAYIIVFSVLLTLLMPQVTAVESAGSSPARPSGMGPIGGDSAEAPPFDFNFEAPSAEWQTLAAVDAPAKFTNYTYQLADNVVSLSDHTVTSHLATAGQLLSHSTAQKISPNEIVAQGGYLPRAVLDDAAAQAGAPVKNGTVFVDETNGTAFKVVSPTTYTGVYDADTALKNSVTALEDTYSVTRPQLCEVLSDFSLDQTVTLTRGNITGFAPNVEGSVVNPAKYNLLADDRDFKYLSDDPLIALKFDGVRLDADLGDGIKIKVTVSGGLGIDSMDLTGRYTGFDGYEIALTLDQECMLDVTLDAEIHQELVIPLYGFNVGFGIGSISGGIFAILGIDGTLRLQIQSNIFTSVTQGVQGGTFLYVPTTVLPVFGQELKVDGNVALSGKIEGYIKFGPMVNLEILGFDLVGAGVFLGAGVIVSLTLKTLDIELYGLFNVYVTIVGQTLNLINFKPTIFKRQQADTGGYRIKFLETFVKPARAGGTIEAEPDDPENEAGYVPAVNIPYRILVVPQGVSFNPNYPESVDTISDIRKYPASGWAATNAEGEFIQMDGSITMNENGEFIQTGGTAGQFVLNKNDTVYLEFQAGGNTYISDPAIPTLPFSNITLTKADYFNDFVTGQVQPIRVLNWNAVKADPPEVQYMWAYYSNGAVHVGPKNWDAWGKGWTYGGTAYCQTDEFGNFDTRLAVQVQGPFNVLPSDEPNLIHEEFDVSLVDHEAVFNKSIWNIRPTMDLSYDRVITPVEGSYKTSEQGGKIVNEMAYNEYIWIINPNGTRTVTEAEFDYSAWGFSTADAMYRSDDKALADAVAALTGNNKWSTPPVSVTQPGTAVLTPILDENGNETGAALFSQKVTVKWVWQAHPNPVKITSEDHTEVLAAGGTFKVTATGYAPLAFSLTGAPAGLTIDKSTGMMTIPAGLAEKTYTLTIRAEEDRSAATDPLPYPHIPGYSAPAADPYQGNDPSPPDEQIFTLTVTAAAVTPEPSVSPSESPSLSPSPSLTPSPSPSEAPRTAPVIDAAPHNYQLSMTNGGSNFTVPITATGSTPITWSIAPASARQIPKEITIDAGSGVLTVGKDTAAGTYVFIIKAQNDVGSDTQECRVDVKAPRTAPVIAEETHKYEFTKLAGAADLTVPIKASGSTPITWSLEPTTQRYIIPEQVTIDPDTGVLTVKKGIASGTYYFTIKASNDVGSDTQACTLKVVTLIAPARPSFNLALPIPSNPAVGLTPLAASSGTSLLQQNQVIQMPMESITMPANYANIVCDHALDVYTNDRNTVDGTSYIRWDSAASVTVEGITVRQTMRDDAPVCDNYHYADPIVIPDSVRDKLESSFKELTTKYEDTLILPGGSIDAEDMLGEIGNFTDDFGAGGGDTYLEFGALIDRMNAQKGGKFEVDLGKDTGTMVPGAYFQGLADNKGASLTFNQEGLAITFRGQNVVASESTGSELYNFAFKAGALHEQDMLAAAGGEIAAGGTGESFTYSFAYHGQLPGTATFNVATNIAEGTKVNVYRFETASGGFTAIAKDVTVGAGGSVTYQNNTMSEYLITTKTIAGAAVSDIAQQDASGSWWIIAAIAAGALLLLGATVWVVLRRRVKVAVKK